MNVLDSQEVGLYKEKKSDTSAFYHMIIDTTEMRNRYTVSSLMG